MLGDEPTIDAVVEALDLVGDAPVVVDPVMVSESGAVLLDPNAKAALIERVLPLATVVDPEPARGAGARRAWGGRPSARSSREAMLALGPARGDRHRRPRRGRRRRALRRRPGRCGSTGPRYPRRRRRTARAAPTPRRSRPSSPAAPSSPTRPAGRARSPPRRSGNGLRELGAGAGPVDVFGLASPALAATLRGSWHNRGREARAHEARARRRPARRGRPRGRRGRGAPGRGVPPPARPRDVGGGADRRAAGAARRPWCATSPRSRATPSGSIFFPPAAGG